jgi:hypothetical protein
MENRRDFLKSIGAVGLLGALDAGPAIAQPQSPSASTGSNDRSYWLGVMEKLAFPVLSHLSRRELKKAMPVEAAHPSDRAKYTHLEAFGRLLAGIAPWLEASGLDADESALQKKYLQLTYDSLDAATDPASPDYLNYTSGGQPIVDAAFLAQGILRAPKALQKSLDPKLRAQVIAALKSTHAIGTPKNSNWVMFAATVECALLAFGEPTVEGRLEKCIHDMLGWYVGDGAYGDGEFFHFDYYNSFVIQPMLLDSLSLLRATDNHFDAANTLVTRRAQRYAAILERLIAPDGTFPSIGRSTTYRFGAFQVLAQMALLRQLPHEVTPPQVRCALTAVIRKMIEATGTFDDNGWLRIGFCGHQPTLAEAYISIASARTPAIR